MPSIQAPNFSLAHTLECGQAFRWHKQPDGSYYGVIENELYKLWQGGDTINYEASSGKNRESELRNYLGLGIDYDYIINSISKDGAINSAISKCYGLRIANQEPWECLISYMLSANNSIPNITRAIENLSKEFGEPLELNGNVAYTFPTPAQLEGVTEKRFRETKMGFRAIAVKQAVDKINSREFNLASLVQSPFDGAKKALMGLYGVGEKIADCVLLFSMGHSNAFPVDTWIRKAVQQHYLSADATDDDIREFGMRYFGDYAGYAQEFLFFSQRSGSGISK